MIVVDGVFRVTFSTRAAGDTGCSIRVGRIPIWPVPAWEEAARWDRLFHDGARVVVETPRGELWGEALEAHVKAWALGHELIIAGEWSGDELAPDGAIHVDGFGTIHVVETYTREEAGEE